MDWMNYFFPAAKPLAQAAQYGNTPPPQGNQDAGIDIAKAAQEQANRTLKAPAPSPVPAISAPPQDAPMYTYGQPKGLVSPGNIDLKKLLPVSGDPNQGGRWGTVHSSSWDMGDGKETLLPTLINGQQVSDKGATRNYDLTGRSLGKFDTPDNADAYAQKLHSDWSAGKIPGLSTEKTPIVGAPYPSSAYAPVDPTVNGRTIKPPTR